MPLDMGEIAAFGKARIRAQAKADQELTAAYDLVQQAYEAGERVNVKRVAELLGVKRQDIYRELDSRGVERLRSGVATREDLEGWVVLCARSVLWRVGRQGPTLRRDPSHADRDAD
jgi:predicted HTH domain antitoxin